MFRYSATRHLTQLLRPAAVQDQPAGAASPPPSPSSAEYILFLLEKYVTHLGIVLQRMIVNKRAIQENLDKGDTLFLLTAPDESHKELLFLLNHAHVETPVEPWLGLQSSTTTKLHTLVNHPQFRERLETEIDHIFHKVQNFVQNKPHVAAITFDTAVYVLNSYVEVYASATANI